MLYNKRYTKSTANFCRSEGFFEILLKVLQPVLVELLSLALQSLFATSSCVWRCQN